MTQVNISSFSQAQVEQRTGVSREALRKWELRYGFPVPERGQRGQRCYDAAVTHKLELIGRLLKAGWRISKLVDLPTQELQDMLDDCQAQPRPNPFQAGDIAQATQALLDTLQPGRPAQATPQLLQRQLQQHGLNDFVAYLIPAFNLAVGRAWETRRIGVSAEHHYSAALRQLVLRALPEPGLNSKRPRVLLATPPGELHSLGLLALHAQLSLQGAYCFNLDCQVPVAEILRVVNDDRIDVVGISASSFLHRAALTHYVAQLISSLPEDCTLWLGGLGCAALARPLAANCIVFNDTSAAVAHWHQLAKALRQT